MISELCQVLIALLPLCGSRIRSLSVRRWASLIIEKLVLLPLSLLLFRREFFHVILHPLINRYLPAGLVGHELVGDRLEGGPLEEGLVALMYEFVVVLLPLVEGSSAQGDGRAHIGRSVACR